MPMLKCFDMIFCLLIWGNTKAISKRPQVARAYTFSATATHLCRLVDLVELLATLCDPSSIDQVCRNIRSDQYVYRYTA